MGRLCDFFGHQVFLDKGGTAFILPWSPVLVETMVSRPFKNVFIRTQAFLNHDDIDIVNPASAFQVLDFLSQTLGIPVKDPDIGHHEDLKSGGARSGGLLMLAVVPGDEGLGNDAMSNFSDLIEEVSERGIGSEESNDCLNSLSNEAGDVFNCEEGLRIGNSSSFLNTSSNGELDKLFQAQTLVVKSVEFNKPPYLGDLRQMMSLADKERILEADAEEVKALQHK
ncbi:hypothetical protein SK128_004276, partial [Halocaridina rubra]